MEKIGCDPIRWTSGKFGGTRSSPKSYCFSSIDQRMVVIDGRLKNFPKIYVKTDVIYF